MSAYFQLDLPEDLSLVSIEDIRLSDKSEFEKKTGTWAVVTVLQKFFGNSICHVDFFKDGKRFRPTYKGWKFSVRSGATYITHWNETQYCPVFEDLEGMECNLNDLHFFKRNSLRAGGSIFDLLQTLVYFGDNYYSSEHAQVIRYSFISTNCWSAKANTILLPLQREVPLSTFRTNLKWLEDMIARCDALIEELFAVQKWRGHATKLKEVRTKYQGWYERLNDCYREKCSLLDNGNETV